MSEHSFELGQRVRSRVTGFTGIIISRCEYLTGCIQYGVKPYVDKDGKDVGVLYHDEAELVLVDNGIATEPQPAKAQSLSPPRSFAMGGPSKDAPSK